MKWWVVLQIGQMGMCCSLSWPPIHGRGRSARGRSVSPNANPVPISFSPGGPGIMARRRIITLFLTLSNAIKLNTARPVNNVLLKSTIDLLFVRTACSIKQMCTSNRCVFFSFFYQGMSPGSRGGFRATLLLRGATRL